jgi:hypothetical protein
MASKTVVSITKAALWPVAERINALCGAAQTILAVLAVLGVMSCSAEEMAATGNQAAKTTNAPAAGKPLTPTALRTAVIRTYPDGYRDDGVGSIYSDTTSVISFYLWHKEGEKPFTASNVQVTLELPDGLTVNSFGVYRKLMEGDAISSRNEDNGKHLWTLHAGKIKLDEPYRMYAQFPLVPWTTACIQVYLRPENGAKLPKDFIIDWKVAAEEMSPLSGTMKIEIFPVQEVPPLKRFRVWTYLGMYTATYNKATYSDTLKMYRNMGVNGLINSGGEWIPPLYSFEELNKKGFSLIEAANIQNGFTVLPSKLEEKMGVTLSEDDYAVSLNGERTTDASRAIAVHSQCPNYYCLTKMQEHSSPVFKHMLGLYEESAGKGFRYFFCDYEHTAFEDCFCPLCRKAFALSTGLPEDECLALKPLDLTGRYTSSWYRFRTAQMGLVLNAVAMELRKTYPDVEVGFNDNFHSAEYFIPDFDSYGFAMWAEDPRVLDPYLDFHDGDVLTGALSSIYQTDLFFQKNSKGAPIITKPVIPRVLSFLAVNWGYHCVFGRMDQGRNDPKFGGMGVDIRPLMQKLEIAHSAALGAAGIEVDLTLSRCDARTARGVCEGLGYVSEFEDVISAKNRQEWNAVKVYDCTEEESPYHTIGPKGFSGRIFYGYATKYGFIQFVNHRFTDGFLTSIFNWDFYQDKKIKVCFPDMPPGDYHVSMYMEGEKFHCVNGRKETWAAEELAAGVGVEMPAGGICAVQVSLMLRPGFTKTCQAKSFAKSGKEVVLYAWRKPKSEDNSKMFKESVYDNILKRMTEKKKLK